MNLSKENNNKWLKAIRKDPFINESAHILADLIDQKVAVTSEN